MRHRILWIYLLIVIGSFFALFLRSIALEDPDFGWHIQTGNLILANGIPQTDPFSYTMPSYPYIDFAWLSDVLLAMAYRSINSIYLHAIFAIFGVVTLLLLLKGTEKKWSGAILFLTAGTLFEFFGIRVQVLSWIFLAYEMCILMQKPMWDKLRFTLPFIFLIWANVHGGFPIGLVILAIFVFGKWIESQELNWKDMFLLLACVLVTLINPYGYHLWGEVSIALTDTSFRWTIQEWYPAIYFTNIAFWIYLMLSSLLIIRYWRSFRPTILVMYIFLLLSGLSSMRNIPIFVIASFYPTQQAITYLAKEASKHKYGAERFKKAYIFFFIMSLCLFLPLLGASFYGEFSQGKGDDGYPIEAVDYLKNNMPLGNIFTTYDWGGFLILRFPEKQVFIDGRMPGWRNPNAPDSESTYAFGDYRDILTNKKPFYQTSEKYDIDTIIFPIDQLTKKKVTILGIDVEKSNLLKHLFTNELSFSYLTPQIKKLGWHEVYRDKKVIIYKRPETGS